MNILLATQNPHKIQEISAIVPFKISIPDQSLEIPEGSTSYIKNALIKAQAWSKYYPDYYILADDSGLEVSALNNAPGIISAEYAGKNASHSEHINKLLQQMLSITERTAYFISYIILLSPNKNIFCSRGECRGKIAYSPIGTKGFGYDPIFLPEAFQYRYSLAELSSEQKNKISHRSQALLGLKDYITYLEEPHD
ncbi:MAG: RdgB/HAM1 family non-canonical purine NTP pyrophosphatase [Brevinema sp.]